MPREINNTCAICGDVVRSAVDLSWKPSKKANRAHQDMQDHLMTHSFAELLRHEIRQDLDQVPEEQRPAIVRDIYRSLLGKRRDSRSASLQGASPQFTLDALDGVGAYSIDEALGDVELYRMWQGASRCGDPHCGQH